MSNMFFRHEPVIFPRLKQHNLSVGRVYKVETGKDTGAVLPSITRILSAKPKPHLEAWRERVGRAEAAKITARAGARGSNLHKLGECYLGNHDLPPITPIVGELWQHLHPWLTEHITCVVAQEQDLYSTKLKVAGRMDLLAEVDNALAVVDLKQANQPKKREWIEDYFLQTTFYACAVYELTGLKVKKLVLPITNPTGIQIFEEKPTTYLPMLIERISEFYQYYDAASNTVAIPA